MRIFSMVGEMIQPFPEGVDFFTLFQLPYKMNLNGTRMETTFYALSRKNHPDFFTKKSPQEQAISMNNTALLNRAYQTLKDPIRRATYLVTLVAGSASIATKPPADLFEEIFALQEALETFKNAQEDEKESAIATLRAQQEEFTNRYEQENQALQRCFDRWDSLPEQNGDSWTEAQKQSAHEMGALLSRRAYFERALGDLAQALQTSEIPNKTNVENVHGRWD